jgi:hypothetical protein
MTGLSAFAAAAAICVTAAGSAGALASSPRQPAPLEGTPLGPTDLRLVVAANPPFVLNVDTGRVTPVTGAPRHRHGVLWIVGVGGRAAAVIAESAWGHARIYAVRAGRIRATSLGLGMDVVPAADRRSVWIQSRVGRSACALRRVTLDGKVLRPAQKFPCRTFSDPPAGSLGLVVNRTRIVDPVTGRTVLRTRRAILAVAGRTLVLRAPLSVLDARTKVQRQLQWPSILQGLDAPAVDPGGRYMALAFADPAWNGGPAQALDVWLLDTVTGKLVQLPGLPLLVSLKRTSMAWTDEGQLVLLGESGGRDFVAVWRPGERRLAVKAVRLPDRSSSGSDSFAPVR